MLWFVMAVPTSAGAALAMLLVLAAGAALGLEPAIVVAVKQGAELITVDAAMDLDVSMRTAWDVLSDFDHMSTILTNLKSSRVVLRRGDVLVIRQEGAAAFGPLSFPFESEREVRLEPITRILVHQRSGTLKRFDSETTLRPGERGTGVNYHAEIVPDSILARMFGAPFVRQEVGEQLQALAAEMMRREQHGRRSAAPAAPALP